MSVLILEADRGRCWVFGLGEHGQLGIEEEITSTAHSDSTQVESSEMGIVPPQKRSLPTVVSSLRGSPVIYVAAGILFSCVSCYDSF